MKQRILAVMTLALTFSAVAVTEGGSRTSSAAATATHVQHVYGTGSDGLWLHPSSTAIGSAVTDLMPEGTEFDVACWSEGDDVNGDAFWDWGTNATTGDSGYAADYYIDTNVTQGNEGAQLTALGIPECGSDGGSSTSTATSSGDTGWHPYCGPSQYVQGITVAHWPDGNFKIELTPTESARFALDPDSATVTEWHAIQACVSGLYGSLADSVWEQLSCHQHLAAVPSLQGGWATGPTYDLESWHGTFSDDFDSWASTHCGNLLGTPPSGSPSYTAPPDEGSTDVAPPSNLG